MNIVQSPYFRRVYRKLHRNQAKPVNDAIRHIMSDPTCGEERKGDLAGVRVYKFPVLDQQFLLAYGYDEQALFLLGLGVHENFYRELKR
ncbi:MAG: type II toxin-antitoxin system RelE/ParE family toxin [Syntrophorhabdaceae bacterium]|nr:type II toxin-antitoxin system RelE/ParE family toxin [Syntrophorhabdaceae bacterium]